jgi:ParB family chromosome partitioning protein
VPADAAGRATIRDIELSQIAPNPRQPRQAISDESLETLASSIRSTGLLQPVLVRPRSQVAQGGASAYELIAGERRWRAARLAGLAKIPAIVRDLDERESAAMALVENLQREDLNPIEQAEAFQRLMSEFGLTHAVIADQVGMNRSSVTNILRLNELDTPSKAALRAGLITTGHAKLLLAITNIQRRASLLTMCIDRRWSVREMEDRVRRALAGQQGTEPPPPAERGPATHMADLERRLGEHLGTKVTITTGRRKGSGRLTIEFYDLDHFEGLMQRLGFQVE